MNRLVSSLLAAAKTANYWLVARAVLAIFWLLRRLPADRALNISDGLGRRFGPWSSRHRIALDNLRQAFPEKSETEIGQIASDMWGNMARLAAEYIFLDRLFDYDLEEKVPGRVEVAGRDIFFRLRDAKTPTIFFTAHLGCFEMFPVASEAFGMPITSLFRAPNNPFLAQELGAARRVSGSRLVPSRAGVAFTLARVLEGGGNIGALVDQKFHGGLPTTFFGRPCETSPLLPKLARQYDCDVHGVRCVRLPDNRYRLEMCEKIAMPRGSDGRVDIAALAQKMNDTVEAWVRENPGQWMWFHRRWEIRTRRGKRGPRKQP
ncbi:MAG: lipid A biosynthesis lauroyl acyltransferase [Mesorhizobium sp.]|nr:lipid A biosynthesis lauroyl acyltransferase [Mesorhizobium sp.]